MKQLLDGFSNDATPCVMPASPSLLSSIRRHAEEYGMVLVLLLLGALFTALTWGTHYRMDSAAVREVSARLINREDGKVGSCHVLIAGQDRSEDVLFSDALQAS